MSVITNYLVTANPAAITANTAINRFFLFSFLTDFDKSTIVKLSERIILS